MINQVLLIKTIAGKTSVRICKPFLLNYSFIYNGNFICNNNINNNNNNNKVALVFGDELFSK